MSRKESIVELANAVNSGSLSLEDYSDLVPRVREDGKLEFGEFEMTVSEVLAVESTEAY
jgi:hypothetical protein